MRYALGLFAAGWSLVAACVSARAALLPGATWRSNDPNPTAPLVETVPPENVPVAERRARERLAEGAVQVGPVTVGLGLSTAAALGQLFGGGSPLLGIYGFFDENLLGPDAAPLPPADPPAVQ